MSHLYRVQEFMRLAEDLGEIDVRRMWTLTPDQRAVPLRRVDELEGLVAELRRALRNNQRTETIDALGHLFYSVQKAAVVLGVDLEQTFERIHTSNMTFFCPTRKDANDVIDMTPHSMTPVVREIKEGGFVVVDPKKGGLLKGPKFHPVSFKDL